MPSEKTPSTIDLIGIKKCPKGLIDGRAFDVIQFNRSELKCHGARLFAIIIVVSPVNVNIKEARHYDDYLFVDQQAER